MVKFKDRVKDSTESAGLGNITLNMNTPSGFQSFDVAFTLTDSFEYCIDDLNGLWETGLGRLLSTAILVRDIVYDGSGGLGVRVNFKEGTKAIFCSATATYIQSLATDASTVNAATKLIQTQRIMAQMVARGQA